MTTVEKYVINKTTFSIDNESDLLPKIETVEVLDDLEETLSWIASDLEEFSDERAGTNHIIDFNDLYAIDYINKIKCVWSYSKIKVSIFEKDCIIEAQATKEN